MARRTCTTDALLRSTKLLRHVYFRSPLGSVSVVGREK
jgi:hypothetical protein